MCLAGQDRHGYDGQRRPAQAVHAAGVQQRHPRVPELQALPTQAAAAHPGGDRAGRGGHGAGDGGSGTGERCVCVGVMASCGKCVCAIPLPFLPFPTSLPQPHNPFPFIPTPQFLRHATPVPPGKQKKFCPPRVVPKAPSDDDAPGSCVLRLLSPNTTHTHPVQMAFSPADFPAPSSWVQMSQTRGIGCTSWASPRRMTWHRGATTREAPMCRTTRSNSQALMVWCATLVLFVCHSC